MTGQPAPHPGSRRGGGRAAHKDVRCLIDAIKAAGGVVEPSAARTGHFKVYLDGKYIGGVAGTPSDHRARQNDIARLRRAGLDITSKGHHRGTHP